MTNGIEPPHGSVHRVHHHRRHLAAAVDSMHKTADNAAIEQRADSVQDRAARPERGL